MKTSNPIPNADKSVNIAFRLDAEMSQALAEKAAGLGVSIHLLAREYVITGLNAKADQAEMAETVKLIHEDLIATREDFALATEALLHATGKYPQEKASEWVKKNLNFKWPKDADAKASHGK